MKVSWLMSSETISGPFVSASFITCSLFLALTVIYLETSTSTFSWIFLQSLTCPSYGYVKTEVMTPLSLNTEKVAPPSHPQTRYFQLEQSITSWTESSVKFPVLMKI
jgi:hypothetical protein